jgi:Fe-S-cluster containining protein
MTIQEKINNSMCEVAELAAKETGLTFLCKDCDKSYCCEHQNKIVISAEEFDGIAHLVTNEHIDNAKKELAKGDKLYKCPFLIDGRCSIYEDRFLVCASYGVCGTTTEDTCTIKAIDNSIAIINPTAVLARLDNKDLMDIRSKDVEITDVLEEFKRRYCED